MMTATQIKPIVVGGQEYYIAYIHSSTSEQMRVIEAYWNAYEAALDAGKNWRRAKREGGKAKRLAREAGVRQ